MVQSAVITRERDGQGFGLPMRRFLTREEAAGYLGMSIDTFNQLGIPHIQLRQRTFRWDVNDIDEFVLHHRPRDSARTPVSRERRGQSCGSTNARVHRLGGSHGTAGTEGAIAEVLELTTRS